MLVGHDLKYIHVIPVKGCGTMAKRDRCFFLTQAYNELNFDVMIGLHFTIYTSLTLVPKEQGVATTPKTVFASGKIALCIF